MNTGRVPETDFSTESSGMNETSDRYTTESSILKPQHM
jgi:hypothetical protein